MILVITHLGRTSEHSLALDTVDLDDAYVCSLSEEIRQLPRGAMQDFVVDRMTDATEPRFYVRPKVPFGSERLGEGPGILAVAEVMQHTTAERLRLQLDIAVEALAQYSTSPSSGLRALEALAQIAALDE